MFKDTVISRVKLYAPPVGIQHISVPLIYVTKSDLLLMDTLILKWHEKIVAILI